MKKLYISFLALLLVITGCSSINKSVKDSEVQILSNTLYLEEDIKEAIDVVKKDLESYPKYVDILKIKYDEEQYMLRFENSEVNTNNIIIYVDYYINPHRGVTGFEPDTTRVDWQYFLSRENSSSTWKIDGFGYG